MRAAMVGSVHRCAIGRELTLPESVGLTLDTAPLQDWLD
jgi:hypothetical protein